MNNKNPYSLINLESEGKVVNVLSAVVKRCLNLRRFLIKNK